MQLCELAFLLWPGCSCGAGIRLGARGWAGADAGSDWKGPRRPLALFQEPSAGLKGAKRDKRANVIDDTFDRLGESGAGTGLVNEDQD